MSTHKSSVLSFGQQLIETRDLDPLYCALVDAQLEPNQLKRFLMSYWMFYHVGVAAEMSYNQGEAYWIHAKAAALNKSKGWPRGTERRHFRGQAAVKSVDQLSILHPEVYVDCVLECKNIEEAMAEVQSWPLFGPWIAFKVVDMLERVMGWPHTFGLDVVLLYDQPRKALDILEPFHEEELSPEAKFKSLYCYFAAWKAPPKFDRQCGPAEVETVLCKWKSSLSGHYWVGKDIHEHRKACDGWGRTASRLKECYPKEVEPKNSLLKAYV